jgi:hypothetical protein
VYTLIVDAPANKAWLLMFHEQVRSASSNGAVAEQESDDDSVSISNAILCKGSGNWPSMAQGEACKPLQTITPSLPISAGSQQLQR